MNPAKTLFRMGLAALVLTGPGCKIDLGLDPIAGGEDGGLDETGEDDELPEPSSGEPETSWNPKLPGALWSLTWSTREPIHHAALAGPGLALAGASDCALIDPSNGYPLWHVPEQPGNPYTVLGLDAEALIWGRQAEHESLGWDLHRFGLDGTPLVITSLLHASDRLAIGAGGQLYVGYDDELLAVDSDGTTLWSLPASDGFGVFSLAPTADGVIAIEARDTDSGDFTFEFRLRELDASGAELGVSGYSEQLALPSDVVVADGRYYVVEDAALWPGHIRAVEPDFGGVAWSYDAPELTGLRLAAHPDSGVLALVAKHEQPAELVWLGPDGEVLDTWQATSVPVLQPILVVGDEGERIVGGRDYAGVLELNRLE